MKLTMFELLGLVKDGKAPKRIRVRSTGGVYDREFYFDGDIYMYKDEGGVYAMTDDISIEMTLNEEVEIIEEKKIPEKIYYDEDDPEKRIIIDKINEIIDYLKSKGDK